MKFKYQEENPRVILKVRGPNGEKEFEAYVDSGAARTLIPENDAKKLGLIFAGEVSVVTAGGKAELRLYKANLTLLNKKFSLLIIGQDLPEQARIKALLGRDILDSFKVCFDGRNKEISFE